MGRDPPSTVGIRATSPQIIYWLAFVEVLNFNLRVQHDRE